MSDTKNNNNAETKVPAQGPGDRLQSARIQQGLTIEEVANRMHLSNGILKSIEENDFDDITAPIFVKGYLRAYSRIVDLDENQTIQHYLDYDTHDDPPIASTANTIPQITSRDGRVKWMTYLVIIFVIVLTISWWWNQEETSASAVSLAPEAIQQSAEKVTDEESIDEPEVSTETTPQTMAVAESTEESTGVEAGEAKQGTTIEQPVTSESMTTSPTPENEAAHEQNTISLDAAEISLEQTPAGNNETESAEVTEASNTPENVEENNNSAALDSMSNETSAPIAAMQADQSGATGAFQQSAPTGKDQLKLVVNADTWAEIKDATGYQLLYDLLRVGETFTLTGQAPFNVFFGNGYGLELKLNDQAFNISENIRSNNTVRMNIAINE